MDSNNIRNFSIIAHIDHGKSTLADRIMEFTNTVDDRTAKPQLLDNMTVEKEHGVTVKAQTVTNYYLAKDNQQYVLNLIDTPGHVDFSYEVSKSLSATEGVILLVDATQGVQAQTIANYNLAKAQHIKIMPVINKIDSPNAEVATVKQQILDLDSEFKSADILETSAKNGTGVPELLEAIVANIPAPQVADQAPELKALVFDMTYDSYQGVIVHIRLVAGEIKANQKLVLMNAGKTFDAKAIGIFNPNMVEQDTLYAGEVGYVVTGIKEVNQIRVGDTITTAVAGTAEPVPGYEEATPVVYAGIFPKDDFLAMKSALFKIALNDSSLKIEDDYSDALGQGFRVGFLGNFHLQIIKERLLVEYGVEVITTSPNVTYKVHLKNDKVVSVNNPVNFPNYSDIDYVEEPIVMVTITTLPESVNQVINLSEKYRGVLIDLNNLSNLSNLVQLTYNMPLSEIAYHFFNALKSETHGYATLSMGEITYQPADVVKMTFDINYSNVPQLTFITNRVNAADQSQELVHKLKYAVPRQLYPMPAQAIVEGKVIARVDIPPIRKNAAVSGEKKSISKQQALLRRQSLNKRKAKQLEFELPQSVFDIFLDI
ncbi:translation elongation factor 4 [Weissella soli]|uniref:translation elongation factor 4 n=1 Tax=Weissella soli TaxID=155866 RepID=UPI000E0E4D05|nr:translation elongation factor 4 [Weissella soli]NKY82853.1 elongation factor 4 [Weissella soli]